MQHLLAASLPKLPPLRPLGLTKILPMGIEIRLVGSGIREGYQQFKAERDAKEVADTAEKHGLTQEALQAFVDRILLPPMIFNAEQLNDLLAPLDLGWRARAEKELALMADLVPLLKKRAGGREISGLSAYEG